MGKDLLQQADIQINGSRAWDIQLHHAGFFKRVLQQGSLGLGESYMEAGGIASGSIFCSAKSLKQNSTKKCRAI